ncbi:peroxiredoxin [Pontibacter sp. HSC-14F20]|uniref:peroxiredoxin n=1 Tax=Pontibacter sp. HSC-14F20 TaxID=2864136 RepID=UPI001C72D68B|nr:peroxiredoxin [Pontibacter sp. HSC-14F20]MBX0332510.1 peroxiredoxin [Pontibacter sp. HSC-14F20]
MGRDVVKIGDKAPDFELQRLDGGFFRLYDLLKTKNVVLYFYPKDSSTDCTKQACEFRDHYETFKELGTEVVCISYDKADAHKRFERMYRLPFTLLSDCDAQIRNLYGVPRKFGIMPGRSIYVIDKKREVQYVFNSLSKPAEHVQQVLDVLYDINHDNVAQYV